MKLDILAFGAHPDDVEISCAGTLISHIEQGKKVGVIDLTRGERGTRGTPEIRDVEAAHAAQIMGIHVRGNLQFEDCFFANDREHQLAVIRAIRSYQPRIVLANAPQDRHPDHSRASQLVSDACFLAGLLKIETLDAAGNSLPPHRPQLLLHYIQDNFLQADIVVDITPYMSRKMEALRAFHSQFYNASATDEPQTYIATPEFLDRIVNRAAEVGKYSGFAYAEGFITSRTLGIKSIDHLF